MDTLNQFKKYFILPEVFRKEVVNKYGDTCWSWLDPRLMAVMIWIREGIGRPIIINTSTMQQRGYRDNLCQLITSATKANKPYNSAHSRGQGFDFIVHNMQPGDVRAWIYDHQDECPYPIRLENAVSAPSWVHLDVCNATNHKLIYF